jgi:hypothetical protein
MKRILLISFLLISACDLRTPTQIKAEAAVKKYLDSLNNHKKYEIKSFGNILEIYNSFSDDPEYDKLKNDSLKSDNFKKHYKPKLRVYIVFVTYYGLNTFGSTGTHTYQCVVSKDLKKCLVGIETGELRR